MVVHNMIQRSANQTFEQVILDYTFLAFLRLLLVTVCLSGTVASTQLTSTGYTTSTVAVDASSN